jgi:hypothetical protein
MLFMIVCGIVGIIVLEVTGVIPEDQVNSPEIDLNTDLDFGRRRRYE